MKEKIIETKICKQCNTNFTITDKDLEFYDKISPIFNDEKISIPMPDFCPKCREQRRLSYINYMNLYKSVCRGCGNNIVSRFNPESNICVYCMKCWASDSHDFLKEGLDVDFNRGIFLQISDLIKKTPFQNLIGSLSNIKNNSLYTNHTADIHNSYMVSESDYVENCMYGRGLRKSNNLIDCLNCSDSEYSYECIDSELLYKCFYVTNSSSCSNSYYLENCNSCTNCIGCVNLNNKEYYILNKKSSKTEYENLLKDFENFNKIENEFNKLKLENIVLEKHILNSEFCSGDYISNSKNCINSYDIIGSQDIKYCTDVNNSTDLMDISSYGSNSSYMYEGAGVGRYSRNLYFCCIIGKGEDLFYCFEVKKSKNCFACVNLKEKQYCILNKQYTKEEYEILVPRIINHMKQIGEWGEFFPSNISPFGYNETVAYEYFPLPKHEALKKGFNWSNYIIPTSKVEKVISASNLPSNINEIPDDILNWGITCILTNKPFRIQKQELEFYRKHNLPIPKIHPNERHLNRMNKRNPRMQFNRKCDKCNKDIESTFSNERKEKVYCKECYEMELY